MAKIIFSFILICFLHCSSVNPDKSVLVIDNDSDTSNVIELIPLESPVVIKQSIKDIYRSYLGVREKTGKNDGPEVKKILNYCGLPEGYSWCSCFVGKCLSEAGVKHTITAWSPTAHNPKNIVWFNKKMNKEPKEGDVFTLYSSSKKRIAHTGFFDGKVNDKIYRTVEGNASAEGAVDSYNGDGVYEKKRSFNATYSITRWTND